MRTIIAFVLMLCTSFMVNAQGINFKNIGYKEALALAKAEKKSVFVDCYTVWCGPCKYMTDNIFVLKEVGDYFNDHFISIKFDMESVAAEEFRNMYYVNSYPTFFFINNEGEVMDRRGSTMDAEKWLNIVRGIMTDTNSLDKLKRKYLKTKSDSDYNTYLSALKKAYFEEGIKDLILVRFDCAENKFDHLMQSKGLLSTSLSKVNFEKFKVELKKKNGYLPEMDFIFQ
ncbi:thioredoxin family protein [Sphingobacterium lumbrici]|uniref:thioredoxin family protein n=1 Tax=Sphingobacterium lumbrici TaxID=2559600 RepID=UPI00112CBD76|nr:thioredoxin fold domain-containing protein [Sphingobacterium lumbrici]